MNSHLTRRELLQAGLYGIGIGAAGVLPVPPLFARAAQALSTQASNAGKILVVLELSGGRIGGLHHFIYPELFTEFGLPSRLPRDDAGQPDELQQPA